MVQYRYAESPIMSTYLLAFVIAHFDYIMAKTKSGISLFGLPISSYHHSHFTAMYCVCGGMAKGVEVRVYLPLGKSGFGKFSLDVAVRSLEFFDEYVIVI
jgi:puromycin-sensitive aminopeptidase